LEVDRPTRTLPYFFFCYYDGWKKILEIEAASILLIDMLAFLQFGKALLASRVYAAEEEILVGTDIANPIFSLLIRAFAFRMCKCR
jgi:hypothetical protein